MSEQYLGGFISKTAPTVQANSAQGIWTMTQMSQYKTAGSWPVAINAPNAPIIGTVSLNSNGTTATVPFTAPAVNGGAAITSYTATSSPGNLTGTINQASSGSITVSGLTASQAYTFTVKATNSVGSSAASSASNSVTAYTVPNAPTIGTATISYTTATVPFTAPAVNGGAAITSYTATSSPGNLTGTINQADSGSITVSGLTASQAYTFTVKATNSAGSSTASSASNSVTATAITVPGAPTIGTVTVSSTATAYGGGFTATVPFTAPANNGGAAITSYTATSSPGNLTGTINQADSGSITVSGLLYSTAYTFTVKATNSVGSSTASSTSNSVSTTTADTTPNSFSIVNYGSATYSVSSTAATNGNWYNSVDIVVGGVSPFAKVPAYINVTSSPSHTHTFRMFADDYSTVSNAPSVILSGVSSATYNGSADGTYMYANASGQLLFYLAFLPIIQTPSTYVTINDPGTYTWSLNFVVNGTSHSFTFALTI